MGENLNNFSVDRGDNQALPQENSPFDPSTPPPNVTPLNFPANSPLQEILPKGLGAVNAANNQVVGSLDSLSTNNQDPLSQLTPEQLQLVNNTCKLATQLSLPDQELTNLGFHSRQEVFSQFQSSIQFLRAETKQDPTVMQNIQSALHYLMSQNASINNVVSPDEVQALSTTLLDPKTDPEKLSTQLQTFFKENGEQASPLLISAALISKRP